MHNLYFLAKSHFHNARYLVSMIMKIDIEWVVFWQVNTGNKYISNCRYNFKTYSIIIFVRKGWGKYLWFSSLLLENSEHCGQNHQERINWFIRQLNSSMTLSISNESLKFFFMQELAYPRRETSPWITVTTFVISIFVAL